MTGRELPPTSAFAGDDGSADPRLAGVLAAHEAGTSTVGEVVAVLAEVRVLVPVLPVPDQDETGQRRTSTGVVAVAGPDGRTALPVFSSLMAMSRWHAEARPVPASGRTAAQAALGEGWDLVVLDPAGPVPLVVPRPATRAIAVGEPWHPAVHDGVVRRDVRTALLRAVAGVRQVATADAVPGRSAEVAVVLEVAPGLTREGLDEVLVEVGRRLGADPQVAAGVDTVELRVRSA